jgi:hypothetical protein
MNEIEQYKVVQKRRLDYLVNLLRQKIAKTRDEKFMASGDRQFELYKQIDELLDKVME